MTNHTFGMVRRRPDGTLKPHQGWDLYAPEGEAVYAIGAGKVELLQNGGDHGIHMAHSFEFCGRTYYAFYSHLSLTYVKLGDQIVGNQVIAAAGRTGNARTLTNADDQHLHMEIRTALNPGLGLAGRIDPAELFGSAPLAVGVPG